MCATELYRLRINGPLLRQQRQLLLKLVDAASRGASDLPQTDDDRDLLEGVLELLDEIADQAHDVHRIDCLEPEDELPKHEDPCECEQPGYFCSGVPGILAHLENGKLPPEAKVERCDLCQRYPSDEAALEKLRELGHVPP